MKQLDVTQLRSVNVFLILLLCFVFMTLVNLWLCLLPDMPRDMHHSRLFSVSRWILQYRIRCVCMQPVFSYMIMWCFFIISVSLFYPVIRPCNVLKPLQVSIRLMSTKYRAKWNDSLWSLLWHVAVLGACRQGPHLARAALLGHTQTQLVCLQCVRHSSCSGVFVWRG